MREKAEKRRLVEEKKKKWIEYLQQLQDEILVENAAFLEGTGGFQVMGTKCKEITTISSEDEVGQQPSKRSNQKSTAGVL